jgi:hypothetical protein
VLAITPNGLEYPFLIPMREIGHRRNIAIWSESPADYKGQWARYLNDWQQLAEVLAEAPAARDQAWRCLRRKKITPAES